MGEAGTNLPAWADQEARRQSDSRRQRTAEAGSNVIRRNAGWGRKAIKAKQQASPGARKAVGPL